MRSQAPAPPSCPRVPGLSEAQGATPVAAGPVHPGEPLRGRFPPRSGVPAPASPPNKTALSGVSEDPSAPPAPGQPVRSSERRLYLRPRPDCWEADG